MDTRTDFSQRRCTHDEFGRFDPAKAVSPVKGANAVSQGQQYPGNFTNSATKRKQSRVDFEVDNEVLKHKLGGEDPASIELTTLAPRSQLSNPGELRFQPSVLNRVQNRPPGYPLLGIVAPPIHSYQQTKTHYLRAAPHAAVQHLQMTQHANAQAADQLITPATTPAITPMQGSFPRMDFSQAYRLPIMSVSKEQLERERKEEADAKVRGVSPLPLTLPGTSVKLGVPPARRVGGVRQKLQKKPKSSPSKQKKNKSEEDATRQEMEVSATAPSVFINEPDTGEPSQKKKPKEDAARREMGIPATAPSVFVKEPEKHEPGAPDICTVHGPGCYLPSRRCRVDQFTWINPETGEHEIRMWNEIPQLIGKLNNLRPDFESIGLDTVVDKDEDTGELQEYATTRTAKPPGSAEFWWDLWIGNMGLESDKNWVKKVCLWMQNARAANEVPRVVCPARMANDADAASNSMKWLMYSDGKGKERLSRMDHWAYLLEEAKWKWKKMTTGKWGFKHRKVMARRAVNDCVVERKLRSESRSSFVEDREHGFEAESIEQSSKGGNTEIRKKVQLTYRRREDKGIGEHWVSPGVWRKGAEAQDFVYRPTTGWIPKEDSSEESVEKAARSDEDEDYSAAGTTLGYSEEAEAEIARLQKRLQEQALVSDEDAMQVS